MSKQSPKEDPKQDSRKVVKTAFLHQPITWPGMCGSEKTLSAQKIPGAKFYRVPDGIDIELKGKTCWIPAANIANAVMDE